MATETEYQAKTRLVAIPAVYLIVQRPDENILLMLRDGTGYQDGNYDLPSGHLEEEDSGPFGAMTRETKEEVGIIVHPCDLNFAHVSYRPKHDKTGHRIDLFFHTKKYQGEPRIMEPHKCKGLIWVPPVQLPNNMVPHVKEAITGWLAGMRISQIPIDWLKEQGLYRL